MTLGSRIEFAGIASIVVIGAAGIGWLVAQPTPAVETAAPSVAQDDGSVVLERAPTTPTATPKQLVPKGLKVSRVVSVTVDPKAEECPPVTVDLTLAEDEQGGKRVIASSPDGQVVAGLDIPVAPPPAPPASHRWAAGISLDPIHQTPGVWVERDLSRFRIGVEANMTKSRTGEVGGEIRFRVGVTF